LPGKSSARSTGGYEKIKTKMTLSPSNYWGHFGPSAPCEHETSDQAPRVRTVQLGWLRRSLRHWGFFAGRFLGPGPPSPATARLRAGVLPDIPKPTSDSEHQGSPGRRHPSPIDRLRVPCTRACRYIHRLASAALPHPHETEIARWLVDPPKLILSDSALEAKRFGQSPRQGRVGMSWKAARGD